MKHSKALIILLLLAGCQGEVEKSSGGPEAAFQPVKVTRGTLEVVVEAPITTSPKTEAVLRSPSKGTLVTVPVVGQRVRAGEVVARLDTEALERAILESQIGVEEAGIALEKQAQSLDILKKSHQTNLTLAQSQLITAEALATSAANLRQAELQYQALELGLKKARLSLEEARENRDDAWIKSPVTGIIASVSEEEGTYVEDNTVLCTVVDISSVTLTGQVDEYDIGNLKTGQTATAVFEALEGQKFESRIKTVSPTAETVNNVPVYSITSLVENREEKIRPGMSGDLTVTVVKKEGLLVPLSAVRTDRGESTVEILGPEGPLQVKVQLGADDGKQVLVLSGLEEGQVLAPTPDRAPSASDAGEQSQSSGISNRPSSFMGLSGPGAGGPPPGGF